MTTFINWCLILAVTAVAYYFMSHIPFFQMDFHRQITGWVRRWWRQRNRRPQRPRRPANRPSGNRRFRQPTHYGLNAATRFLHGFLYDSPYYPIAGSHEVVTAGIPTLGRTREPKRLCDMNEYEGYAATYSPFIFWLAAIGLVLLDLILTSVVMVTGLNWIWFISWLVYQSVASTVLAGIYLHRLLSARIVFAHGFMYKSKPFKSKWTTEEDASFGRCIGGPYGNVFLERLFRRVPPWFWPGTVTLLGKESSIAMIDLKFVQYPTQLRLLLDDIRVRFEQNHGIQTDHLRAIRELLEEIAARQRTERIDEL